MTNRTYIRWTISRFGINEARQGRTNPVPIYGPIRPEATFSTYRVAFQSGGSDVIIAFIGRSDGSKPERHELLIEDTHPDFRATGLKVSSVVKLDKLTTVQNTILVGEIGELSAQLLTVANEKLRDALDL